MKEVVIISAARTPFGKFGGALKDIKAADLGGLAIKEALKRANIAGSQVDEVIMGMVVPAGQGQIPARQASIKAGIPHAVPAFTINKVCGSALKAITLASQIIRAGDADIIVAGGMENMSNIPYISPNMRWGARMNNVATIDAMVLDGLWCPENNVHMAVIGGQVAKEYNISREEQDSWAYRSQQRWQAAEEQGKFDQERFSIELKSRKGKFNFSQDESPRSQTTLAELAQLPPLFVQDGTVTAGNAPGVNDGAAAVVVMSKDKAMDLRLDILATIRGHAQVSSKSKNIASVPGLSIQKLMEKFNLSINNFDLIEINEAFAAVPLVSCKLLGLDKQAMDAKVNVNGSAVATGHPIGVSEARILMTLIYELRRTNKKHGVCAICSGMGQGDAVWLEIP